MKKYALTGLILLLVGCTSDDTSTTKPKETEAIEEKIEEEKVEVVKELTDEEKEAYDYELGIKRINDLDLYFDMYWDLREAKKKLALVEDKTMNLELAKLGVEMQEHLSDFKDLDTLYDKDYEMKINEYSRLLSETIHKMTESNITIYKKYIGEAKVEESLSALDEHVSKHDEMMIVRDDVIDYHNNKFD